MGTTMNYDTTAMEEPNDTARTTKIDNQYLKADNTFDESEIQRLERMSNLNDGSETQISKKINLIDQKIEDKDDKTVLERKFNINEV